MFGLIGISGQPFFLLATEICRKLRAVRVDTGTSDGLHQFCWAPWNSGRYRGSSEPVSGKSDITTLRRVRTLIGGLDVHVEKALDHEGPALVEITTDAEWT